MPYDDIRFSHWDEPDDDFEDDQFDEADVFWDDDLEDDYPCEAECVMCGKERCINAEGYCSSCWLIWNS